MLWLSQCGGHSLRHLHDFVRRPTILDHFVRDSALLGLDACAGHNNAGIDTRTIVAQAQIATVRSVRPDTLGFRRHLEKVAAALSVVSGAVSLRSCWGSLVTKGTFAHTRHPSS